MLDPEYLRDEAEIVWLRDPATMDYVRETLLISRRPLSRLRRYGGGHIVGYAVLVPRRKRRHDVVMQRIFWLKPYDRPNGGSTFRTGAPCEAVDPLTVRPGVPGRLTERAWGRPLDHNTSAAPPQDKSE
jgi:hypothetical protein